MSRTAKLGIALAVVVFGAHALTRGSDRFRATVGADELYDLEPAVVAERTYLDSVEIFPENYAGRDLGALYRKTGLRLIRPTRPIVFGKYSCEKPDEAGLDTHVDAVRLALGAFPRSLLLDANTRFVMLCKEFKAGSVRAGGLGVEPAGVIVADTDYSSSPEKLRNLLRHEFFHMVDFAQDRTFSDSRWQAVNPSGFRYRGGGRLNRGVSSSLGSGGSCFASEYGESDVAEDKAELFRFLLTDHDRILSMARTSPCLEAKIEMLKADLEAFNPGVDASFWNRSGRS